MWQGCGCAEMEALSSRMRMEDRHKMEDCKNQNQNEGGVLSYQVQKTAPSASWVGHAEEGKAWRMAKGGFSLSECRLSLSLFWLHENKEYFSLVSLTSRESRLFHFAVVRRSKRRGRKIFRLQVVVSPSCALSLTSTEVLQCAEVSPAISAWSKASFFMCEAGHLWEGTLPDIRPMSFH